MQGSRLPKTIIPSLYKVRSAPDLERLTFAGTTSIECDCVEETDLIAVNCNNLDIKSVAVVQPENGDVLKISKREVDEARQLLLITLSHSLLAGGKVNVTMEYTGTLNDRMQGFYRVDDQARTGNFGAACHFEATGAREAFPCFDEPLFRARFLIAVDIDKEQEARLTVLSNMPEARRESVDDGDKVRVHFEESPKLPTYLVSWCVGFDYESVATESKGGIPVRVHVPKGKAKQAGLALEVASTALDIYADFFRVDYPLPKMDLISFADFAIGAMENWGLLTFRERFLMYDEAQSSANVRLDVAIVVAHEVAHQWFGNLVTLEWWTDLWLKEGYATWISYLCADKMRPDFEAWTQFLTQELTFARELDALESSHPIEVEVGSPAEIDEIFDAISYCKGSSIIRFLFNWIGEDAFRSGMNAYLNKFCYGNAQTRDLWESLGDSSGKPVGNVMSTWTRQTGFPVITATIEAEGRVKLKQGRFKEDGSVDSKELWSIPLEIATKSSASYRSLLMAEREICLDLADVPSKDWVNLNPGGVGFYRVKYQKELLDRLIPAISDMSLPKNDRLNLISDQTALAAAGYITSVDLLQFLETFRQEKDCLVWEAIGNSLWKFHFILREDPAATKAFNRWVRWLFGPTAEALGWASDSNGDEGYMTGKFRSIVQEHMVAAKDELAIQQGRDLFAKHLDGTKVVPADLRRAAYMAAMASDGAKALEKLLRLASETDVNEEQVRVYSSLGGGTDDPDLLQRAVDFGMSTAVRYQDTWSVFSAVGAGSARGARTAWAMFKAQKDELARRYKTGGPLNRIVKSAIGNFSTLDQAADVENFFAQNPFPGAARAIRQAVEKTKLRAAWMERDKENVKKYLISRKYQ